MKKGFTLLELMIVLSIFVIMTTVLVANHRKFGNNVILSNLAEDVALSIREAQTYGLGSKDAGGGSYNNPFGMYIDTTNNRYILFADIDNSTNSGVDGFTTADKVIKNFVFPGGNRIDHFCVIPSGGVANKVCSPTSVTGMSITFLRPAPDARIIGTINSVNTEYKEATICLKSDNGKTKQVEVLTSGQIDVVDTCD